LSSSVSSDKGGSSSEDSVPKKRKVTVKIGVNQKKKKLEETDSDAENY